MISLSGVKASIAGSFFLSLSIVLVVFFVPNTNFSWKVYDLELNDSVETKVVLQHFDERQIVRNTVFFRIALWALARQDTIPPGLFQIQKEWSNWSIIHQLKTPPPSTVPVVIKPFQNRRNTLQRLCKDLDIKYTALQSWLEDDSYVAQWGDFNKHNAYCLLIPDTFLVFKDSRARDLADRLFRKYQTFWNPERLEQAAKLGLTKTEVGILASIVYAETKIPDEMPVIAGLYLNRLQRNMRLQADPTVVFASGKSLTRILKVHKNINSEYNTYRVHGFPPGPVFTPTPQAIDAVLSAASHDYLYFCAKNDFSGYHHFSRTFNEHLQVARKYQRELNRRQIGLKGS